MQANNAGMLLSKWALFTGMKTSRLLSIQRVTVGAGPSFCMSVPFRLHSLTVFMCDDVKSENRINTTTV